MIHIYQSKEQSLSLCTCTLNRIEYGYVDGGRYGSCIPGLPDFSWNNLPKQEKIIPNDQTIYQIAIK
jgi:hypothetical protein